MIRMHTRPLIESLARIEADLLAAMRQALGQSAAFAMAHAKATGTFKDRTGRLRGSIERLSVGPFEARVRTGPGVAYAEHVEEGTRAHVIRPKRARFLRFVVGGRVVFARRVRHPGTAPRRFMESARDAGEERLVRFVEAGLAGVFR